MMAVALKPQSDRRSTHREWPAVRRIRFRYDGIQQSVDLEDVSDHAFSVAGNLGLPVGHCIVAECDGMVLKLQVVRQDAQRTVLAW
jgi:hypothetical protein